MKVIEASICIEEERQRNGGVAADRQGNIPCAVEEVFDRCVGEKLRNEFSGVLLAVTNVESDEADLVAERNGGRIEQRCLGPARDAP